MVALVVKSGLLCLRAKEKPTTNPGRFCNEPGGEAKIQIFPNMAYNKRNFYLKIIEIQDVVLRGQRRGDSQKEIFYREIEKNYFISMRTFYTYLDINAKAELKKLDEQERIAGRQLVIAF